MNRDEHGSGSMLTVGVCLVLLAVGWAVMVAVAWIGVTRSAQATADLAALAGASALFEGHDGCDAARIAAHRNGVELVECSAFGGGQHVVVEVTVEQHLRPSVVGYADVVRRSAAAGSP